MLVDRVGRKFLLSLGSAGIILSLIAIAVVFRQTEKGRVDCAGSVQSMVTVAQRATIPFSDKYAARWLADQGAADGMLRGKHKTLIIIYSYGDFRAATKVVRSTDEGAALELNREGCVPANRVIAFFTNPFADFAAARTAPLKIENALLTPIPDFQNGVLTALFIFCFMAFFAVGPGVCVWLALSELMPTRIRSNGMSVALLINQAVSTTIAVVFLPTVGKYGYATMFFIFAGCTVIYFITATYFLPERR